MRFVAFVQGERRTLTIRLPPSTELLGSVVGYRRIVHWHYTADSNSAPLRRQNVDSARYKIFQVTTGACLTFWKRLAAVVRKGLPLMLLMPTVWLVLSCT